jgi:tRNA(Ile2)-agmatinylcytidine synthase
MNVGASSTFWIGLDDTDEREQGCTTYDFNDLLTYLSTNAIKINDARLVRLWPFAPQRTRGNAALSASVQCNDYDYLERLLENWFNQKYFEISANPHTHSAQPTLLLTRSQLPEHLYWETVRSYVDLEQRMCEINSVEHRLWNTEAGCMGVIGASAAIAWRGQNDWTWECTAWRKQVGVRYVPEKSVTEMSEKFPETILNRDPNANRSLIAPRTPCPVLYGIRGENEMDVISAHTFLQNYPVEKSVSHRAFRTNQATDDHLDGSRDSTVRSVQIMTGGHVKICADAILLAFAPGGPTNQLAQSLQPGDEIRWFGLCDSSGSYHLEKLRLIRGSRNHRRPKCACGSRYKSKGVNQKLKCPSCESTTNQYWEFDIINSDWTEPPASARRHLSKPLARIGKSEC